VTNPQSPVAPKPAPPSLTTNLAEIARGYQRVLERDPRQPQALVGMSLVALASRQPELAVKMATAGAAAAPNLVTAWIALGQALKASGQQDEAERAYMQALRLDGTNPTAHSAGALAHMGLGELALTREQPEPAAREFESALKRQPTLAGACLGLGNALALMGRNEEALDRYEWTLLLHPRLPEAEFAAGFALARLGRIKEAETRYRRAIAIRPDFAAAWMNLGSLLREQGRELLAEAALRRSTELRPDLVSGWINLAVLERERNRPAETEKYLRRAFTLNPDQVETLIGWCQFRLSERDLAGAWAWLRWALLRDPNQNEAVNMQGILLHTEGCFAEAVAAFERAEALGNRAAASNRGNSLLDLGRMVEALRAHEIAVERDPTHPGAAYNLALTRLRLGDWERGWPDYEARWNFREVHRAPRQFKQPRWNAATEPHLAGRRILLHAEQGLGDTLQFCRYAALVVARGGVPILEVQPPAERLLRSLEVVRSARAEIGILGAGARRSEGKFDLECPLLSLPAAFRTTVETVPQMLPETSMVMQLEGYGLQPVHNSSPITPGFSPRGRASPDFTNPETSAPTFSSPHAYLFADPEEVAQKRAAFPSLQAGLRVGLAWAGNPRYKADRQRSLRLETLLPLLRAGRDIGVNWISLQKDPGQIPTPVAAQIAALPAEVTVQDGSSRDRDLAETAALLATLDLVITTDTCIAHLAGALGKPVWILLPHLADWRWLQDRETTPWYPTARLIRQRTPGDWPELLARVARYLTSSN
jgi:tetratricopeptide (TPR) repeat protein